MTPETKAFIEEAKDMLNRCREDAIDLDKGKISKLNIQNNYESVMRLVHSQDKLIQLIESQEKEIERLEAKLTDKEKDLYSLSERLKRFYVDHHPNSVQKVIGFVDDDVSYSLMIKNIITTNDGAFVEVYLPSIDNRKKES